jgi:hypothetical protein
MTNSLILFVTSDTPVPPSPGAGQSGASFSRTIVMPRSLIRETPHERFSQVKPASNLTLAQFGAL